MEIKHADVAELVDARDLKSCVTTDDTQGSCKTATIGPVEAAAVPPRLQNKTEIDTRLAIAITDAGRSALGMPCSVDTLKAMLARAGLALVLA